MKLKIPPPLIALIFGLLMWGVSTVSSPAPVESVLILPLSMLLLIAGFAINVLAAMTFRSASTTMNPMKPNTTTQLVNTGVYKVSRNPMYLGTLFVLSAWAVWLGIPFNGAVLLFFVGYITAFQIIPEEKALEVLFPVEFESYKSRVRRWI